MNYKEIRETIDGIIDAITKGDYSVSYEEPNNIRECTAPDGRTFYKFVDMDDAKSSNDFGSCIVDVGDYVFSCDWGNGDYESRLFDEFDEEYQLEDGSFICKDDLIELVVDAFNERDDIYFGEYSDMDSQMELFARINQIANPEYYWCEDDDCPVDIDDDWTDYTAPKDLGYGTVIFEQVEYYLVEKPSDVEREQLHAVSCGTKPDDNGYFDTVLLEISHSEEGEMKVIACEQSDDYYNAIDGWIE